MAKGPDPHFLMQVKGALEWQPPLQSPLFPVRTGSSGAESLQAGGPAVLSW